MLLGYSLSETPITMILPIATAWWPPILQTAIGAIAAILGGAGVSWITWQKERQSLANALAGEIQGFIGVLNWRNARELLQQGYQFPIDEGAFPVFAACVGKIGLLPSDLAGKVTEFYGYAGGIVRDFKTLDTRNLNHIQADRFRANLVKGIDDLEAKATILVPELRKEAARSWIESS
jgi:hypothetical protein